MYSKGESITLKGHMGAVRSVEFSRDGRLLLTGSDDKTAKVPLTTTTTPIIHITSPA